MENKTHSEAGEQEFYEPAPDPTHVGISAWPTSPMGAAAAPPQAPPSYDPYADPRPLPSQYGRTRLTVLVRDPEWIFAFWEISGEDRQRHGMDGPAQARRMVLRVYDTTGSRSVDDAHRYYDVPVTDQSASWYLHISQPDRTWIVDLGYYDEHGNFRTVARSNQIVTPRDSISNDVDEQWMLVDEERFRRLVQMSTGPDAMLGGSERLGIEVGHRLFPQFMPGASEVFALGASERFGASERLVNRKAAPFHLQVRYELVVYGATEPDANVTLNGDTIRLRPDGTFTVRYEMPDGERDIAVKAFKATGDQSRETGTKIGKKSW